MIRILAIGKKHETWVDEGIQRYEKRLTRPWTVEWALLPHSSLSADRARQDESERILMRLKDEDFVVLLDEHGTALDSPALSRTLLSPAGYEHVGRIIGGAYGVDAKLIARADLVWSLSPLVFPHQLVRLILIEQLYRAQEIANGKPYHHQ